MPIAARMSFSELAARLNTAAEAGAHVAIRYALGSRAVTHRIKPIAATGTVLRAHDLNGNRMRVFLLAHLELVDERRSMRQPCAAADR